MVRTFYKISIGSSFEIFGPRQHNLILISILFRSPSVLTSIKNIFFKVFCAKPALVNCHDFVNPKTKNATSKEFAIPINITIASAPKG